MLRNVARRAAEGPAAPRILLACFCLVLCAVASTRDGHSFESVDVRQYGEMILAISRHGLPIVDNGPSERFVWLRVPWNVFVDGRLWSSYAPLYPYLVAPLYKLGWKWVWKATFALLVPLALFAYALGKRVLESEWYALLASVGVVASTPILGKAYETTGFPLAMMFACAGAALGARAVQSTGAARLRAAAATGFLYALGSASHLLCFPLAMGTVGALAIADGVAPAEARGPAWLGRTPFSGFWPTRETLTSAAVAFVALVLGLTPVALLNKVRFGSYNPLSYGPTEWPGAVTNMNVGDHLRYAAPVLAIALLVVASWIAAGVFASGARAWMLRAAALVLGAGAIMSSPTLREHATALGRMAVIVTVDASAFELGAPYYHLPKDGLGNLVGPWVLKSTLQATPIVGLVFALPRLDLRRRHVVVSLLLPVLAFYVYLTIRANIGPVPALGWAWVSMRYTLPALPALYVAALLAVREVGPRPREWIAAIVVVGLVLAFLRRSVGDDQAVDSLARHVLLLVVPVVLAIVAVVLVRLRRRALVPRVVPALAVTALVGLGFGFALGHDLPSHLVRRTYSDWRVDGVRDLLPQRVALVGWYWDMDQLIALKMERDLQYGDQSMAAGDLSKLLPLIDHWRSEARPVYLVSFDPSPVSPWPDLDFKLVSAEHHLFEIVSR